jgi:hypothetical protein
MYLLSLYYTPVTVYIFVNYNFTNYYFYAIMPI